MKKFGTFNGVFVPSFEAILGAVLFLVLPSLVIGIGIEKMIIIVLLANSATLATAFSISDCATNLEYIGAGGIYALSKRSLGKAFGGSIGIQLFIAQAASIGFYAIGFADPLQKILLNFPILSEFFINNKIDPLTQQQIIASIVVLIAFIAAIIGASFIIKIQMIIFIILSASVLVILLSPYFNMHLENGSIFKSIPNLKGLGMHLGFWAAFTAFFPAVTGIDAGVGMSGNLKNPKRSLSRGTFIAIAITSIVYLLITVVFGYVDVSKIENSNHTITAFDIYKPFPLMALTILIGILFATGSSALSYFMTAPYTAQALANDGLLPGFLKFLKYDFLKSGKEPRFATLVTLFITIPVIWSGDVTFASMVVGICFLAVYGWINLAAFLERFSGNPSFRPTSWNHWSISLYGFLICITVIGLFNIYVGIIIFTTQTVIFYLLLRYKSNNRLEGVWWGFYFSLIAKILKKMNNIIQGTKNWRPIMAIYGFADYPEETKELLAIGRRISDYKGLVLCNILAEEKDFNEEMIHDFQNDANPIKLLDDDYDNAIYSLIQTANPGGLKINTVLLPIDRRLNLVRLIEKIIHAQKNVILYKPGNHSDKTQGYIDIWWRGEENGNLMALLGYIIVQSDKYFNLPKRTIRIIRISSEYKDSDNGSFELKKLLQQARLKGEAVVIPDRGVSFYEMLREVSGESSLIMLGMPGKKTSGLAKFFSIDKVFFSKEFEKYKDLPPILFVKAAGTMQLIESYED